MLESERVSRESHVNYKLVEALDAFFKDNCECEGNTDIKEGPLKFVYFLDHDYTEHSLRWNLLKGTDYDNAASFHSAAKQLELISHLTLVEIHETWTTEYDEPPRYSRRGYRDYSDSDSEPVLEDLIEEDTSLSYWIDADNKKLPYSECSISEDYICWTKETEDFEPTDSEYEGYTSNAGCTMDYW